MSVSSRPLASVRHRERMTDDRAQLDALLAATTLAHLAYVDDEGRPCVIPVSIARWDDRVVLHGSSGSRWLRTVADGRPVAISVAELTGVVVGHRANQTGVHGRSAVLYGHLTDVTADEKPTALNVLLDRHLPGRSTEVAPPTKKELAATRVLALPLDQWSCRVLDDNPKPPGDDADATVWSGVVTITPRTATAEPSSTNQAEVPPSVARLATSFDV